MSSVTAGRWARRSLLGTLAVSLCLLAGRPVWAECAVLSLLALLLPLLALRLGEGISVPGRGWLLAAGLMAAVAVAQLVPLPPSLLAVLSRRTLGDLEAAYPGWPDGRVDFGPARDALLRARPPENAPPAEAEEGAKPPLVSVSQVLREAGLRTDEAPAEGMQHALRAPPPVPPGTLSGARWRPLSLAPWRTRGALVKLLVLSAALALASSVLRAPSRAYPFAAAMVVLGALVGLLATVQILKGAANPLDLLGAAVAGKGREAYETFGPFPNKNHLAGFLALLLPVGTSLALSRSQAPPSRILWGTSTLLMALGILAARSRGGIIAAAAGLAVLSAGLLARPGRRLHAAALLAAGAIACTGLLVWAPPQVSKGVEGLVETRPASELRLLLWRDTLRMVPDYPVAGTGLDAFSPLFPRYKTFPDPLRFSHVENDYLQYVVETGVLGLPALLLAAALLCIGVFRAARSASSPVLALGAWAGVMALAVHGVVDFNFHVTANALGFLLVLALAVGCTPRPAGRRAEPSRRRSLLLLSASILAAVGTLGFCLPRGAADALLLRARADEASGRTGAALAELDQAARFDPWNPMLREEQAGARRVARALDPRPESGWARASLEAAAEGLLQAPTVAALHRAIGRLFYARGDWPEAARWFRRDLYFDPADPYGHEFLGDALRRMGDPREAVREYAEAVDRLPAYRAEATFSRILDKALATSREYPVLAPLARGNPVRAFRLAEALDASGARDAARQVLGAVLGRSGGDPEVARGAFGLARRVGDEALARRALEVWEADAPGRPGPLRERAQLLAEEGKVEEAVALARRALAMDRSEAASYRVLAGVLRRQGGLEEALDVAREGVRRHPGDAAMRELLDRLARERYIQHEQEMQRILRGED